MADVMKTMHMKYVNFWRARLNQPVTQRMLNDYEQLIAEIPASPSAIPSVSSAGIKRFGVASTPTAEGMTDLQKAQLAAGLFSEVAPMFIELIKAARAPKKKKSTKKAR